MFLQYAASLHTYRVALQAHFSTCPCWNPAATHTRNVVQAPSKDSKQLSLQYAMLEETYGLARHTGVGY